MGVHTLNFNFQIGHGENMHQFTVHTKERLCSLCVTVCECACSFLFSRLSPGNETIKKKNRELGEKKAPPVCKVSPVRHTLTCPTHAHTMTKNFL